MRSNRHVTTGTRAAKRPGDAVIRQALQELENRARQPGVLLNSYNVAADWFRLKLGEYEHEVFAAAWLDNRKRLIAFEELFRGTLNHTAVPTREVVKSALRHNAAAVLFAHNHPSGCVTSSGEDMTTTLELGRALDLVDVRLLDHFVVSATEAPLSIWVGAQVVLRPSRGSSRSLPNTTATKQQRGNASTPSKAINAGESKTRNHARRK